METRAGKLIWDVVQTIRVQGTDPAVVRGNVKTRLSQIFIMSIAKKRILSLADVKMMQEKILINFMPDKHLYTSFLSTAQHQICVRGKESPGMKLRQPSNCGQNIYSVNFPIVELRQCRPHNAKGKQLLQNTNQWPRNVNRLHQ